MNSDIQDTWHPGERMVQTRAGVNDKMSKLGPRVIRNYMLDQHRKFFASLPMVITGSQDENENVWAYPLFGDPGFIQSPTPELLSIKSPMSHAGPALPQLNTRSQVGLLGIDLETRRRNRLNGTVLEKDHNGFTIGVEESFGNCPQYIQQRRLHTEPRDDETTTEYVDRWSRPLRECITNADTCFIASTFSSQHTNRNSGMDVSHRGGQRGFLGFDDRDRLIIPDFPGNSFFNTVGNLTLDPRAGLLFLDFSGGNIITLTMSAEIIWKTENAAVCGDHDRVIRLSLKAGYVVRNALPYRWKTIVNPT